MCSIQEVVCQNYLLNYNNYNNLNYFNYFPFKPRPSYHNIGLTFRPCLQGRRKVRDWWWEELYKMECQVAEGIPSYLLKNQWVGCSLVLQ